jgi:hypothetical protein
LRAAFQTSRRTWSSASVAHSGDVEGIQAHDRLRAAARRHVGDPARRVGAEVGELAGASIAEGVEAPLQRLLVAAGRGPDQPAGVVIDDHGEVAVALLVGQLVHPDPPQPSEPVGARGLLGGDPGADPADAAPGDAQQLADRRPGGVDRKPRAGVLERSGEPGPMPRPRHRSDRHPVDGAAHPGRVCFQEHLGHPEVQRAPAAPAFALVIAGTASVALRTPPSAASGRPRQRHDRLGVLVVHDLLDDGVLDTQQPLP